MRRLTTAWPWVALLIGLLAMAPGLLHLVAVEQANDAYELSMPDAEVVELLHSGLDDEEVYGGLIGSGLRSVAVEMETAGDLEDEGRLIVFSRSELLGMQLFADEPLSSVPNEGGTFVALTDESRDILARVRDADPSVRIESITTAGRQFHLVSGITNFEEMPLGFDDERIAELRERGLEIIARIPDSVTNPAFVRDELSRIRDSFGIDRILFSGDVAAFAGSPDEAQALATWLEEEGFNLVLIEFVVQEGIDLYAGTVSGGIRLHALNLGEEVDPRESVNRGVRALKERNIRILFLRPTATLGAEIRLEELTTVMAGIGPNVPPGMHPGEAQPFDPIRPTPLLWAGAVVASAAIAAATGGLLGAPFAILAGGLMALLGLAVIVSGSGLLADLLRLGVAILGAVLAVFVARPARRLGPATIEYLKSAAVVLAAGVTLAALAYGNAFLINAQDFWGVKALLLAPPALVAAFAAYQSLGRPRWSEALPMLGLPVRAWHVAAVGVMGAAVWYLLLRSGNTGAAFDIELAFRQELENLLYVRPRTKEFLIGFPALLMGVVLTARTRHAWWLYVAAAVGTASAIDTFTHFHAPLLISLLRTTMAVGIGYAIGLVGLGVVSLLVGLGRRLNVLPR